MILIQRIFLLFCIFSSPILAVQYASIVLDAQTGKVIHQANADAITHPASLTKMMTLYLAFKALDQGKLRMDQPLKVSKHASGQAPSKLGLKAGSTITVKQAIMALITKSANDAAAVLGEALGGDIPSFARNMTQEGRRLGMSKTVFRNASGLPDSRQVTTARDMATLAQSLHRDFPHYYAYFNTQHFVYKGQKHHNHNHLLGKVEGVDGIKTGYIAASGFNLAASAKRNGRRIFAVVMGGKSWRSRDQHMVELLEASFKKLPHGKPSPENLFPAPKDEMGIGDLILTHDTSDVFQEPHVQVATYAPTSSAQHAYPAPPAKPQGGSSIAALRDIEEKYDSLDALLNDIHDTPTHMVMEASYSPPSPQAIQKGSGDSLKPLHKVAFTPPSLSPPQGIENKAPSQTTASAKKQKKSSKKTAPKPKKKPAKKATKKSPKKTVKKASSPKKKPKKT